MGSSMAISWPFRGLSSPMRAAKDRLPRLEAREPLAHRPGPGEVDRHGPREGDFRSLGPAFLRIFHHFSMFSLPCRSFSRPLLSLFEARVAFSPFEARRIRPAALRTTLRPS